MNIPQPALAPQARAEQILWTARLAATTFNCAFQIAWFWRFRAHSINEDGIAYVGLARHLVDGDFKASLHGYWSPLTSWIIAAASVFGRNFTLLGRLATIASFLLCLAVLYVLTLRLWRSRAAAALAVFWLSAARGLVFLAVGSIVADFVLTACVLLYFTFLLDALRQNTSAHWIRLGAAHGLAFLAKAIAMPWLAIAIAIAVLLRNGRSPRRLPASFLLAPAMVWISWGTALRTKYGVFTTGYQLRANLMTNWRRQQSHRRIADSLAFADTSSVYDNDMVGESWPSVQTFSLRNAGLLNMIVAPEVRNIPQAVKETLILLAPDGALAFPFMLTLLFRNRGQHEPEAAFAGTALVSTLSLIVAYCMLVFDGRYLVPIVPVLIAICCPLLLPFDLAPCAPHVSPGLQKAGLGLLAASIVFFAVYWASPFRTVDRDFEASCYQPPLSFAAPGRRERWSASEMAPIRSTVWDSKQGRIWRTLRDGGWWEETPNCRPRPTRL